MGSLLRIPPQSGEVSPSDELSEMKPMAVVLQPPTAPSGEGYTGAPRASGLSCQE
jgi:hypothetical protein